jgi:hypothetical protein
MTEVAGETEARGCTEASGATESSLRRSDPAHGQRGPGGPAAGCRPEAIMLCASASFLPVEGFGRYRDAALSRSFANDL